jgi:phosphate transport system substrate-binding protein
MAVTATALLVTALGATPAASASAYRSPNAQSSNGSVAKVSLTETGSTLLEPLFQIWTSAYEKKFPNVNIVSGGGGSGKGISDASNGVVDIGASDAYLSGSDRAEYSGLQDISLAISSQMVNYNLHGLDANVHLKLNGKVLSAIYQGKITTWDAPQIKALNPGVNLPSEKIVALHRADSSGDTFLFSTYLSDADPSGWGKAVGYGTSIAFPTIPNALGETGNGGMVTGCQKTPGCVAYIGISYESKTQAAHLGVAALGNASGNYEVPTATSIKAEAGVFTSKIPADEAISMIYGKAPAGYPIINYEYAIVPAKEPTAAVAQAVKSFLGWAVSLTGGNSASYLGQVNFQALPPSVVKQSDNLISKIGS